MSLNDNVTANPGAAGAPFRCLSDGTNEWPASVPSYVTGGSAGAWALQYVELAHGLPVVPGTGAVWACSQSGTWNIGTVTTVTAVTAISNALPAGNNNIGDVDVASVTGNVTVVQPTAASLNATIVGTGTLAVQAAQSGTWNITNISGTVSLPTGASTVAKQPALGTAGSASADVITVQGIASGTALTISGTVTANAGTNLNTSALATVAKQPALGTAGSASADVITIQGVASMTPLLVTPAANSAVNMAQVAGTTTDTNSGTKSAGTIRVVIATDQPQLTNKLLVTPDANSAVNIAQVGGTNVAVTNPLFVTPTPSTTGGWTPSVKNGLSNTNSQVKSGAGTLGGWFVYNPNATVAYVQIYDTATGSITVGTTVAKLSIGIPATSAANLDSACGINFATAICVAATTTATGSTAPGTALDCNFWYK